MSTYGVTNINPVALLATLAAGVFLLTARRSQAILAIALSWIIQATGPQTATRGATIAAALWFGFIFTTWATEYAFEARSISVLAINTGYVLVGMLLMGLVLGGWKAKPRAA